MTLQEHWDGAVYFPYHDCHILQGKIVVRLSDGKEYPVHRVSRDRETGEFVLRFCHGHQVGEGRFSPDTPCRKPPVWEWQEMCYEVVPKRTELKPIIYEKI